MTAALQSFDLAQDGGDNVRRGTRERVKEHPCACVFVIVCSGEYAPMVGKNSGTHRVMSIAEMQVGAAVGGTTDMAAEESAQWRRRRVSLFSL